MEDDISTRLNRLEELYTEQEYTIQALNQITTRQAREIDQLRSRLELINQQYRELKTDLPLSTSDEKPPHY
jgi:uncharacterized coiled-coil protein SlyX